MTKEEYLDYWQERLGLMGVTAAIFVVLIHTPVSLDLSLPFRFFIHFVPSGVCKVAIPFFFFASGYFVSRHFNEKGWYTREINKRILSLLIPMIIWGCILLLFYTIRDFFSCVQHGGRFELTFTPSFIFSILGLDPFNQPFMGVFWYVRSLFFLVLFSPLLRKIACPTGIVVTWLLYGFIHPDYCTRFTPWSFFFHEGPVSIWGATYFMLGIYCRKNPRIVELPQVSAWSVFIIGIMLFFLRALWLAIDSTRQLPYITWIAIPFVLIGSLNAFPFRAVKLRAYSFPVYVLHMFFIMIIGILGKAVFKREGLLRAGTIVDYLLIFSFSVICCLFTTWIMRRFMPKVASVLFGGR